MGPQDLQLKRVLLVDDDPLVRRIYQQALSASGFHVDIAEDGLNATRVLRENPPDVIVLDLMMPRLNGVDVLKFIRSNPSLGSIPVAVLSNSYMDELAQQASELGVQRALLKIRCTPSLLSATLRELLGGEPAPDDSSALLGASAQAASIRPPAVAPVVPQRQPPAPVAEPPPVIRTPPPSARDDFLANAEVVASDLRTLFEVFQASRHSMERELRLQNLYRKVHFISATAGLADCHVIAQMSSAFEALLYGIAGKPDLLTASMFQTMGQAITFITALLSRAAEPKLAAQPPTPRILVVDDNALTSRLVVSGLRQVGLQASSCHDPLAALDLVQQSRFDMVLLDIEMPHMDGLELCRRLRSLPSYEDTPVIFVTSHSDFETRAKSVVSGGDDLISQPVFPMELTVKAVMHLLKKRIAAQP